MAERALVLSKGKALFEQARRQLLDQVQFLDLKQDIDVPSFGPESRTMAIIDSIMARTPFRYVVAMSESDMAFAGFLRSRYGLPGMDYERALMATNKWRMKQAVRSHAPVARSWLSGEFLDLREGRPPCVVLKPLSGSSARGVRRLPLEEAVRVLAEGDELLLVEEALDVTAELHCDGLVRGGRLEWVIVSAYSHPVLASKTSRASTHLPKSDPRVAPATDIVHRVLQAFPLPDCVFHLELLDANGSLFFGETGLRPAGGGIAESIARCFGSDLWLEFVAGQIGVQERLSPLPPDRQDLCGVLGVVLPKDPALSLSEALQLPGVTGMAPGDLPPGHTPEHSTHVSHLLFFENLDRYGLDRLIRQSQLAAVLAG